MRAVQILAPNDPFIHQAAGRVPEETLPVAPGGAALEFVVAMERLRRSVLVTGAICGNQPRGRNRVKWGADRQEAFDGTETVEGRMQLKEALCVKSAEYWLKLGEPAQALTELDALHGSAQTHPWVVKMKVAAIHAAREQHAFPAHAE